MLLFTVYNVVLTAKSGYNKRPPCIPLGSTLLRLRRAFVTTSVAVKVGQATATQSTFVVHRPVAQRALRMQRPTTADQDSPASSSAGFDPAQLQYRTSQAHQSSSKSHSPAASSFAASAADTAAAMSTSLRQTSDELQSHASQVQGHIHCIMHMLFSHQCYVC